jgi:hypothetical protein
VLPLRNAVGRNRCSLATLASASPHGVGPLSEDITPSTQTVRVRTFACANVLILMSPEIAHDSYRVIRLIVVAHDDRHLTDRLAHKMII